MNNNFIFTSESVTEGHPDKVADYISDSVLDACLEQDTQARVACETLCKDDLVVLAGEITTSAEIDFESVARRAIREIGYTDSTEKFSANGVEVLTRISRQSPEIDQGVTVGSGLDPDQGAGDQGMMFGYASDETPELMPLPILLAHRITRQLAADRKSGKVDWLRPDGKSQVSVQYRDGRPAKVTGVLVSTQHRAEVERSTIVEYVRDSLLPEALGEYMNSAIEPQVNPTGSFCFGGPNADCGLTGRKIVVDTYGGFGRHGGGAFSGKDATKVDRSAAYYCRHAARRLVQAGYAERAEIQVAYAIGLASPQSVWVNTFNTGDPLAAREFVEQNFDFRPAAIIEQLGLRRPIFRSSTNYGHFGRPGLPWEA